MVKPRTPNAPVLEDEGLAPDGSPVLAHNGGNGGNGDPFQQGAGGDGGIDIDTTGWSTDRSLPEGDYRAVLLSVEMSISQAGNKMLVWDFALIDGPYAGKEFRTWTVLSENQAWKLQQILKATALGKIGDRLHFQYADYVNRMVILRLVTGERDGEKRSEIKSVFPPVEGPGYRWTAGVPDFADDPGPRIPVPGTNDDLSGEEF